ncbi:MAG: hypothetical protein VX913_11425, partial [Planctomycetota bacterium]|nr:hypothetical protein [Planctomycetota bacterium]
MPKSGLQHAMGKDNSKRNMIIVASIAGAILLTVIIVAMSQGGGDDTPGGGGGGGGSSGGGETPIDAYKIAYSKAYPSGSIEDVKRLCEMAWKRHQAGQGDAQQLRMWESHWRWSCRRIIDAEPDNALAHERLGDVLFDLKEAEAMVE